MSFNRIVILLAVTVAFFSCRVQKPSSGNLTKSIESKFGTDYQSEKNSGQSLILVWNMSNNKGTPVLKYAIWDIVTSEQIYKGTAIRGKVAWLDQDTIELHDYPGIIDDESPLYKYKINVRTGVKTAIHENEKF